MHVHVYYYTCNCIFVNFIILGFVTDIVLKMVRYACEIFDWSIATKYNFIYYYLDVVREMLDKYKRVFIQAKQQVNICYCFVVIFTCLLG